MKDTLFPGHFSPIERNLWKKANGQKQTTEPHLKGKLKIETEKGNVL